MRRRIVGAAVASAVLALLLFLVPLAIAVLSLDVEHERAALEREALNAALVVDSNFSVRDPPELPAAPAGVELGLYDGAGRLLAGTGPRTADGETAGTLGLSNGQDSDGWLVSVVPVSASEKTTGAVRAATAVSSVWQRVAPAWAGLLLAGMLAVFAAWLVARRSARQISTPVEQLADASVRLGNGDFNVQLASTGIGELDQAGQALQTAAVSLEDLVTRERMLAANVSHQLRTPLAGLRAVLEVALAGPEAGLRAAAEIAVTHADRLDSTIEEVIALTRGNAPSVPEVVIAPLVEGAVSAWNGRLAAQSRPLRIRIDAGLPGTAVAPSAIRQILDVLLENALKHGQGPVTVSARLTGEALAVDVADNGGDVADDSIFLRGVSGDGGSGMGLALARRLAEDQGGRLLLSQRTPLTRFTLLLPLRSELAR